MRTCIHTLRVAQLHHPDFVETQIEIGNRIKPLELFRWSTGEIECCGPIHDEALVFFIQQAHLAGEVSGVINDLIKIVDDHLRQFTAYHVRRRLPKRRIPDFSASVSDRFWFRILDPSDEHAGRAQVCFRKFVAGVATKLLNKERREQRRWVSEYDPRDEPAYRSQAPTLISQEDALLIEEALQTLALDQQRAFTLLHYRGLTVTEIAAAEDCTERTVYNRLRAAAGSLHQLIN